MVKGSLLQSSHPPDRLWCCRSRAEKHCRVCAPSQPSLHPCTGPHQRQGQPWEGVGLGRGMRKELQIPSHRGGGRAAHAKSQCMSVVPTDFTYKTKSKIILLRISECWLHSIKTQGWGSVCTLAGRLQSAEVCPSAVGSGVLGPWPVHQEDWFLHPWSAHSSVGPAASRTELSMILFSWEKNYRNKITDF